MTKYHMSINDCGLFSTIGNKHIELVTRYVRWHCMYMCMQMHTHEYLYSQVTYQPVFPMLFKAFRETTL